MGINLGGKSRENYISIHDGNNIATAFRETNGEITIHLGEIPKNKSEELTDKASNKDINISLVLLGLFFVSLIVKEYYFLPNIKSAEFSILWYLLPFVLSAICAFVFIHVIVSAIGDEGCRNHGAEHMVILAYEKLRRIPNIDEVKNFSRIADCCGVTYYSAILTGQLIGFTIYCITGTAISEIVLLVVPIIFSSYKPFNLIGKFFQLFTTKEPNDENLELAIAALTAFLKEYEK